VANMSQGCRRKPPLLLGGCGCCAELLEESIPYAAGAARLYPSALWPAKIDGWCTAALPPGVSIVAPCSDAPECCWKGLRLGRELTVAGRLCCIESWCILPSSVRACCFAVPLSTASTIDCTGTTM
jgi:hypothetical protein